MLLNYTFNVLHCYIISKYIYKIAEEHKIIKEYFAIQIKRIINNVQLDVTRLSRVQM